MARKSTAKTVATLQHEEAKRKNIPTAEFQSVLHKEQENPVRVAYERRTFAEFTEAYQIEADFERKVEAEFNSMIERQTAPPGTE